LIGIAFCFATGFIVARFRMPALIVTLGTWQIWRRAPRGRCRSPGE
jgi:ribose/xylose/arabinose/galactoside ABC-type transport system permease subunit